MNHLVRKHLQKKPSFSDGDIQVISNALDHYLISQGGVDTVGSRDGVGLWTFSHYDADVDIADPHDFFIDVHADWDAWVNFKVESKEDHLIQMYRTPTLVAGNKGTDPSNHGFDLVIGSSGLMNIVDWGESESSCLAQIHGERYCNLYLSFRLSANTM